MGKLAITIAADDKIIFMINGEPKIELTAIRYLSNQVQVFITAPKEIDIKREKSERILVSRHAYRKERDRTIEND